ncbi:hypothetical protein [Photobacterium damselae]|uniref:hypothetical protein n=1 Tax=Photobacterium damselae TaxID=38293 RepID=UPI0040695CB2
MNSKTSNAQFAIWNEKTQDFKYIFFAGLRWLSVNKQSKNPTKITSSLIEKEVNHLQSVYTLNGLKSDEYYLCLNEMNKHSLLPLHELNKALRYLSDQQHNRKVTISEHSPIAYLLG